jgi:hypothetical protein
VSLLQEALKRKEEDESRRTPETVSAEQGSSASLAPPPANAPRLSVVRQPAAEVKATAVPPVSPPQSMPVTEQTHPAASQRTRRKMSSLWIIVAIVAVFIGLMVTGGIAFFFYRVLSSTKAKIVQPAGITNTTAVAAAGTNTSAGQLVSVPNPRPEIATVAKVTAPQSVAQDTNKAATSAIAQNTETNSVQQQSAENVESKPTPAKLASFFKPKAPAAGSRTAKWPALKLTGILRGTGKTESTAFINGKMIGVGQTIADVTVVEIQADGVILKYGNEKRFLRVGATSY